MSSALIIHRAGPALTVQDLGRNGYIAYGLSRGGAADRLAMIEGAALLGQDAGLAALEMGGYGGVFEVSEDTRIALTGAPMQASVEGRKLLWSGTHQIKSGQQITIGAAQNGLYGYLHVGGGIATKTILNSRSVNMTANIGGVVENGASLPIGRDENAGMPAVKLAVADRFQGGLLRLTESAQTSRFSNAERERFTSTAFVRSVRGNRQGARLDFEGAPFAAEGQLSILSEIIVPGDVQMTGAGTPFILLPECQTTGGYPRIGTIIPQDHPKAVQAAPGTGLNFQFIALEDALETLRSEAQILAGLRRDLQPLVRDPREIRDLLDYQLISGVTAGHEE